MVQRGDIQKSIDAHFPHENVWVKIPPQPGEPGLKLVQKEMPERWDLPPNDGFELSRRVINFEVYLENGELLKSFNPPMLLRVGLTPLEVKRQIEKDNVKLAYAVGKEAWVELDGLVWEPESRDVVVEVTQWGDPPMAVGR